MERLHITIAYSELRKMIEVGKVSHFADKRLNDGHNLIWYHALPRLDHYILINETVFMFSCFNDAEKFVTETKLPPPGTVNYRYQIDQSALSKPVDLNYRIMSFNFFKKCRLDRGTYIGVLSENVLNDGRTSIIYSKLDYISHHSGLENFLVIGKMVFCHYRMVELKKLEFAINDGSAIYWRPELSGTMDYMPKYSVSVLQDGRQKKFISQDLFLRSYGMPCGTTAEVYKWQNKNPRYYMRWRDRLYSFSSMGECEIIVRELQTRSQHEPVQDNANKELLKSVVETMAARLGRYMTADMNHNWYQSKELMVSSSGKLLGLNAIV